MLPVLAILLLGVIDLGRAYHLKNQLKNAAREGAIYGQTHPLSQTTLPASNNPVGAVRQRAEHPGTRRRRAAGVGTAEPQERRDHRVAVDDLQRGGR